MNDPTCVTSNGQRAGAQEVGERAPALRSSAPSSPLGTPLRC